MAITEIDVKGFISKKTGCVPIENQEKQLEWSSWYVNDNGWRIYNVLQNGINQTFTRNSLNSCARVCKDWASLIMSEPVTINCTNSDEVLQALLKELNFMQVMNKSIEKDYALGGGALVWDFIPKTKKVQLQFVDATHCYPLDVKDDIVTGCAFAKQQAINGKQIAFVSVRRDKVNYNYAIDENGTEVDVSIFGLAPVVKNAQRTFSFFTPRNIIKDDWNNPFGSSIFADALDANKLVDEAFDSFINEFKLGKKRIFLSQDLLQWKAQTDGTALPVFDTRECVFNMIPKIGGDEKIDIKEVNMALRITEHEQGIQAGLNYLSSLCGLGSRYYKYDNGSIATATQVISENSDLFRNIKKEQLNISVVIKDFVNSAMAMLGIDCGDITIMYDDSIIIDRQAQMANDQLLVADKLMSPIEFRMRNFGETEEQAKQMLGMIEPEEPIQFEEPTLTTEEPINPDANTSGNS